MAGCGCGCNGEAPKGMGCAGEFSNAAPVGVDFEFGLPMAFDGVPISSRLPGYEGGSSSSSSSSSSSGGGIDTSSFNSLAQSPVLGCPLWVWAVAGALVFVQHKRGR